MPDEVGRLGWIPRERYRVPMGHMRFCEADRHRGQFIDAAYVIAFVGKGPEDGEEAVWGACLDCTEQIAQELGTTATAGAL